MSSDTGSNRDMWPPQPRLSTPWAEQNDAVARAFLDRLKQIGAGIEGLDDPVAARRGLALRATPTSFYPGYRLCEFLQPQRFGLGTKVVSLLIADTAMSNAKLEPNALVHLNGTSPPIHAMNKERPPKLDTAERLKDYLKFFCTYVSSEQGGFLIVESVDDIWWMSAAEDGEKTRAAQHIAPAVLDGSSENSKPVVKATVCYASHLFRSTFEVDPSGMVEMTDDDPVLGPLPVRTQKIVSGARLWSEVAA